MRAIDCKLSVLTLSLILAACGGGGGGGGGVVPTTFTSWSDIEPGSTVKATGVSGEVTYQYDLNTGQVTSVSGLTTDTANSSVTMTFDDIGDITTATISTPTSTVSLTEFAIIPDEGIVLAVDSLDPNSVTAAGVFADNEFHGYEYQTFGIWEKIVGSDTAISGAISIGAPTAGSAIPTVDSATFTGKLVGDYVDTVGNEFITVGEVSVGVNFVDRSLAFTSSNTDVTQDFIDFVPNNNLNLTGTLIYAPATNSFSGSVTSANGMTGGSNGKFYGPSAQELGGVFFLQGVGVETYGGAYGAVKQVP